MYKVFVRNVVVVFDILLCTNEIFCFKDSKNARDKQNKINREYASKSATFYPRYELNSLQELASD